MSSNALTSPEYTMGEIGRAAAEALGYDDPSELDVAQPLGELGFDSMMSIKVRNALLEQGIDVPLYLLNGGPSVVELSAYVMRRADEGEDKIEEQGVDRTSLLTHAGAGLLGLVAGIALVVLFANLFPQVAHGLIPGDVQVERAARGRGF